ncbi:hypothetical protein PpBr36_03321 [Pyricularia pennisetigena]|uniref:hypothetical protein n=1 Tax=Pyricularia pennisetigena TaxID=1578925 RepID=UPI00114D6599|nr:hypothetical protein PpBr36_03321 [Pyricularia pennisetigena]TLS30867.1 hypothetical protein PpBr36_03321 [Pyricularia pennisetigena]
MFLDDKTPSKSAVERDNPPPRRKACQGCIKAKRRCDLGFPTCLRCSHRHIECLYDSAVSINGSSSGIPPSRPARFAKKRQTQATSGHAASEAASQPLSLSGTYGTATNIDGLSFLDDPSLTSLPVFDDAPPSGFPGSKTAEFIPKDDGIFAYGGSLDNLLGLSTHSNSVFEGLDLDLDVFQAPPQNMDPVPARPEEPPHTDLVYLPVATPTATTSFNMSYMIRTRLSYTIPILLGAPKAFVETTGTPWSHPSLYKDGFPPIIEDMYAACALYMARTPRNDAVIMRSIEGKLAKVINDPLPSVASTSEVLYRTQALLMYQIMRTLDEGLASRAHDAVATAAFEESMNTLKDHLIIEAGSTDVSTTFMLSSLTAQSITDFEKAASLQTRQHGIRRPTKPLQLYPLGPTRAFWEQWTFKESVRRTFLMAFFFSQLTRLVTGATLGTCTGRTATWNCWTLAGDLWGAPDAVDFAQAWNTKHEVGGEAEGGCGPIIVSPGQMQRVLQEARAEDMDDFARMILTTTLGVEEAKAWLASKGGVL